MQSVEVHKTPMEGAKTQIVSADAHIAGTKCMEAQRNITLDDVNPAESTLASTPLSQVANKTSTDCSEASSASHKASKGNKCARLGPGYAGSTSWTHTTQCCLFYRTRKTRVMNQTAAQTRTMRPPGRTVNRRTLQRMRREQLKATGSRWASD